MYSSKRPRLSVQVETDRDLKVPGSVATLLFVLSAFDPRLPERRDSTNHPCREPAGKGILPLL